MAPDIHFDLLSIGERTAMQGRLVEDKLRSSDPGGFLDALGRVYVIYLQDFWFALHGLSRLRGASSEVDIDTRRRVDMLIAEGLCELVDAWLASGCTEEGCEYPYRRHLSVDQIPGLNLFLREQPNGAGVHILWLAGTSLPSDPDYPELDDITHRSKRIRQIALDRKREGDGMRSLSALRLGIETSWPLWQPELMEQYAANESIRLFLTLLNAGGARFLLVRCHKCLGYDFTKTREKYLRGWHCKGCRKRAADAASARSQRDAMQATWMNLAIKARRKYKPGNGEQAVWLCEQMNKKLPPMRRVKRNWITKHLDEIEDKAEGGTRPKR